MPEPMSEHALADALPRIPAWSHGEGSLRREFRFRGFADALSFIVRVGLEAERRDHHPDLRNVYDRVWITLTSHDAGGVTERDLGLAGAIDGFFAQFGSAGAHPGGGSGEGGRNR